jgi:parallel beta-helix repeat protein
MGRGNRIMKSEVLSGLMLTLLLLSIHGFACNIQPVKGEPKTWTVDDYATADFHTIQDAINAASPGDTVLVSGGTYYEHLSVDKPIQLQGENKHNTIIDGNSSGTLIYVNSNNVTISGFTLRNSGRTWLAPQHLNKPDCAVWAYNCYFTNISDNIITGAAVGIFIGYVRNAAVSQNNISENEVAGIIFYSATNSKALDNTVTSVKIMGIHLDYYSSNCLVANNSVVNNPEGIALDIEMGSTRNLFEGNLLSNNFGGIFLYELGSNNVFRGNNMTENRYNIGAWGFSLSSFIQDIDTSNTVNNKPILYMVNKHHVLITSTNLTVPGYLALVNSSSITVEGLNLSNNMNGILLAQATNCTLKNLNLSRNHEGMLLFNSNNNTILNNWIADNSVAAIVYSSNQNVFYHNSFINNTKQILSQYLSGTNQPFGPSGFSTNKWDSGLEGNFWSDYNGIDSNGDGIGDSPYIIDANNQDKYPLMNPWTPSEVTASPAIIIAVAATIIIVLGITLYFFKTRKR